MAAERKAPPPDALELAATGISAVLILALLAFLVWDAFQPSRPATFEVLVETPVSRAGSAYVPVAVRNTGEEAARSVEVKVTGTAGIEGRFTIDWLPGRSTRRGFALLPANALNGPLTARVEGYAQP